jgi:hypothetical protein
MFSLGSTLNFSKFLFKAILGRNSVLNRVLARDSQPFQCNPYMCIIVVQTKGWIRI